MDVRLGYALGAVVQVVLAPVVSRWTGWNVVLVFLLMTATFAPLFYGAVETVSKLIWPPQPPDYVLAKQASELQKKTQQI